MNDREKEVRIREELEKMAWGCCMLCEKNGKISDDPITTALNKIVSITNKEDREKKLKYGDDIILRGKYVKSFDNGNIRVTFSSETEPREFPAFEINIPKSSIISTLPKITEEELKEALPKKGFLCETIVGYHDIVNIAIRNEGRNQAIDNCFNSISALLKKKGILAQKEG